jgi:hypothetical protein
VPFSDNFEGTVLNPDWIVLSQNPDSSVGLTGSGFLNVTASPKNGGSDLWPESNWNAPRVLQAIDPLLDWTIETRFNFAPTNDYQDAGILLAKTATASENSADFWRIAMRSYYPSGGGNVIRAVGSYVPYSGTTSYLRIEKSGTTYTGWWSSNGSDWTLNGSITKSDSFSYLGLVAVRQAWDGNTSVYSSANYDYFNITVSQPVFDWIGGDSAAPTDWGLAANWNPGSGVPDGVGVKVSFGNQDSANNVVDLISASRTVGSIAFAATIGTTIQSTGGHYLRLDNGSSVATLNVTGNHTINAPLLLNSDVEVSGPGTLNLSGGVSGANALNVLSGNLTAANIQVNALSIGASAKVTIQPLVSGILSGTPASVPEPATLILLSCVAGVLFVRRLALVNRTMISKKEIRTRV